MTRRKGNGSNGPTVALGAIERQVDVRLIDISLRGCMFESRSPVEAGMVGTLTVHVPSMGAYEDVVRIERVQAVAGRGSLHHVGATFMWAEAPGERSLRRLGHDLPTGAPRPAGVMQLRRAVGDGQL